MKQAWWAWLVMGLVGCAANPQQITSRADVADDLVARVDRVALSAVERVPLDALSVVVLHGNDVLVQRGYGGEAVTADTIYRIGSITKLVTALGIARLVERGALGLDDSLDRHFPNALPGPAVTIRQLLNHTSGLASHERAAVMRWREQGLPITDAFVWQHLGTEPRVGAPGTTWSYSSGNFHLLGLLIERLAGMPFATYVQREIAAPLDLSTLRLCSGQPAAVGQRPDYVAVEGRLEVDRNWALPGIGAGGGLCASARDVARLVHAVAQAKLVSEDTLARMTAPTPIGRGARIDYGLGARLGHTDGADKWGHTGGGAVSNRSVVAHYPEHDLTIAVLANTERSATPVTPMDIEAALARLILELPEPAAQPDPNPDFSVYVGAYAAQGRTTVIELGTDGLRQRSLNSDDAPTPLRHLGGHEFLPWPEYPDYRAEFQIYAGVAVALAHYDSGWFAGLRLREE